MKETLPKPRTRPTRPRVAAVVGLTLLEVLRRQDLPTEVLESEDTTLTMPRRLGLSDVVERQIRRFKEEVRRGKRMSDHEMADLVRLVIRRPDSEEVFGHVGTALAAPGDRSPRWHRALPVSVAYALSRRAVRTRLRRLFGRRMGGFAPGPFTLEGRGLIFIQSDPGGDACHLVTTFCQVLLERYVGNKVKVVHSLCESRRDPQCRWTVLAEEKLRESERVRDLLLNPGPG